VRRRPERSLRDPATLRRFVEQLHEGIYITSASGEILDANPALLEILGYTSLDELRAAPVDELYCDPERRQQELAILARAGEVREFELELRTADGTTRTVLDSCFRVSDPRGGEDLFHGILVDITARKRLEARLRELSLHDALTGCYNRRLLEEFAARHEGRAVTWGAVMVDVDRFKRYNDRYGHAAGDRVLRETAEFLRAHVRGEDAVVRLGGDEFLILVLGRAAKRTAEIASRLAAPCGLTASISCGWSVRRPGERLERTIARADAQLLRRRARRHVRRR
jgi:diguanylate cyclase (GGDEF)-like protein/PAS domain S-box-containing protein